MTFKQYCEMILRRKLYRLAPRKQIKALKSRHKGMNSDFVIVDEWMTSPNAKSEADKFYRFLKETTGGLKDEK